MKLDVRPLTSENWPDLEALFGRSGAYGGCWCMWWRLTRSQFERQKGAGNRQALRALVSEGETPGVLGYLGGDAVGWCSIAPRDHYPSLNRSPVLKPIDQQPVWSLVCLYVAKPARGQGLTVELVEGAVAYAQRHGGKIVEAYPTAPRGRNLPPVSSFMGVPEVFARAGFKECAQPSAARVIMRRYL